MASRTVTRFIATIESRKRVMASSSVGPGASPVASARIFHTPTAQSSPSDCSAGFQPAVSPTSSRQAVGQALRSSGLETRDTAGWKPALRRERHSACEIFRLGVSGTSCCGFQIPGHSVRNPCQLRWMGHFPRRKWLPDMDLNHDKQIQSLLCYRYTIGQAPGTKVEVLRGESSGSQVLHQEPFSRLAANNSRPIRSRAHHSPYWSPSDRRPGCSNPRIPTGLKLLGDVELPAHCLPGRPCARI